MKGECNFKIVETEEVGEDEEDTYGKWIDRKNEELDEEVERIVKGTISKIITAALASGVPCDPDTSDGIKYIESCLDKMKKGEKN